MLVAFEKLGQALARIFASTEIETTYDAIAYHGSERPGELRFSRSPSLRQHY
jgi:hypothetical protein